LADARRQYQTLQRENQLLRMVMAQSGRLAAATQPAPVAAADPEERSRLLAQAEEELRQAKAALEKLETVMGSPASMPATADAPPGKKAIRGAVLVVRGATVVIDIGSQDGLRKDTPLEVYRGEQFIGVLRLTAVGENTAEGLLDGRVGANEGDKVVEGEKATGGRE
jgi:cell shape-determining protein MreC